MTAVVLCEVVVCYVRFDVASWVLCRVVVVVVGCVARVCVPL